MERSEVLKSIVSIITVLCIAAGVVVSVVNIRMAREKEAQSRKIEAARPFLELRQKLYLEALRSASIIATKEYHTQSQVDSAKKRFAELYWGELSLIEDAVIESHMKAVAIAENMDSSSTTKKKTLSLAHAMRESLINSWGVDILKVGKTNK